MILYHFTDKKVNKLKVKYSFNNAYSLNDYKACNIKRIFFYTDIKDKEGFFKNSQYCYKANIPDNKIYNLIIDNKNLKSKYNNIYDIIKAIKKLKYKGVLYNVGFNIVNLFYDINITN